MLDERPDGDGVDVRRRAAANRKWGPRGIQRGGRSERGHGVSWRDDWLRRAWIESAGTWEITPTLHKHAVTPVFLKVGGGAGPVGGVQGGTQRFQLVEETGLKLFPHLFKMFHDVSLLTTNLSYDFQSSFFFFTQDLNY